MADEENAAHAQALGFRQPPDNVTEPCLTYMARVMELRDFISYVFSFVETSTKLGTLIPKEGQKEAGDRGFRVLQYNFSKHRPLVNQMMLSRSVETFDLYLTTILWDIFLAKPEMLKSDQQLDATTIIDAGSYDEVILKIVERRVQDLSYKSLMDLRKYIERGTGLDLFQDESTYETVLVASELRNLIAHNDCMVNSLFEAKIKGVVVPLERSERGKILISDVWLRKASYTLDAVVFRFDELAAAKFGLRRHFRMGTSFAGP